MKTSIPSSTMPAEKWVRDPDSNQMQFSHQWSLITAVRPSCSCISLHRYLRISPSVSKQLHRIRSATDARSPMYPVSKTDFQSCAIPRSGIPFVKAASGFPENRPIFPVFIVISSRVIACDNSEEDPCIMIVHIRSFSWNSSYSPPDLYLFGILFRFTPLRAYNLLLFAHLMPPTHSEAKRLISRI